MFKKRKKVSKRNEREERKKNNNNSVCGLGEVSHRGVFLKKTEGKDRKPRRNVLNLSYVSPRHILLVKGWKVRWISIGYTHTHSQRLGGDFCEPLLSLTRSRRRRRHFSGSYIIISSPHSFFLHHSFMRRRNQTTHAVLYTLPLVSKVPLRHIFLTNYFSVFLN